MKSNSEGNAQVLSDSPKEKQSIYQNKVLWLIVAIAICVIGTLISGAVEAYTVPATTDPGYDFYDLVMNKGLDGPVGFAIGAWLLINAGTTIGQNPKSAALQAIGGGMLIKAEAVATTLGWMI